jgi:hypothetical protein
VTARGPAPIQIRSRPTGSGWIWNVYHNGELVAWSPDGKSAIEYVDRESRAIADQRRKARNMELAKAAVKLISTITANIHKNR